MSGIPKRKGVFAGTTSNSLDWDSPSTKTGTVKRRPVSGDLSTPKTTGFGIYEPGNPDGCTSRDANAVRFLDLPRVKTGKVSDNDSGIASPLSPSSLSGFLGYEERTRREKEEFRKISAAGRQIQVILYQKKNSSTSKSTILSN